MVSGAVGICEAWWAQLRAKYQTTSQTDAERATQLYSEEDAWILTKIEMHRVRVLLAVLVIVSISNKASY